MPRSSFAAACWILIVLVVGFGWGVLRAQGQQPAAPPPPARLDRDAVVSHLNLIIAWYRDSTTKVQTPGEPSDVPYQDNAQNFAAQALRLAFQSAEQEAEASQPRRKGPRATIKRRLQTPRASQTTLGCKRASRTKSPICNRR